MDQAFLCGHPEGEKEVLIVMTGGRGDEPVPYQTFGMIAIIRVTIPVCCYEKTVYLLCAFIRRHIHTLL